MIHFPTRFACGLANFPVAHWPSFLENTAPVRQAHRRGEYGDERIPEIREFLEKISPINRTSEIKAPLQIAHGDTDSRIPVDQAIRMWQTVLKSGVHCELMVCEKEGHGEHKVDPFTGLSGKSLQDSSRRALSSTQTRRNSTFWNDFCQSRSFEQVVEGYPGLVCKKIQGST